MPTYEFAEVSFPGPRLLRLNFYWLGGDGDVYQSLQLRYNRHVRTVRYLVDFSDFGGEWNVEGSETFPSALRQTLRELWTHQRIRIDELTTRCMSLFPSSFQVLTQTRPDDLYWDHHWHAGPQHFWRPTDLGTGLHPFAVRSAFVDDEAAL